MPKPFSRENTSLLPVPAGGAPLRPETPTKVTAEMLLSRTNDLNVITYLNFGSTVSLEGVVRNLPAPGNNDGRLSLESGGFAIPVDASSCPEAFAGLSVGCRVNVTGVFLFEANNWRANAIFPKINDIAIVVRGADDVRILSRPSRWTPELLLYVIGLLVVAVAAVLAWNWSLRVLAERRGRELARAQVAKKSSELKVDERTRLATELHDYVSQELSAISYQVSAAKRSWAADPEACAKHLETADRMLGSCRTELRRCMWDLRNEAIDEHDMEKAVKTSIEPIAGGVEATVRMAVPRILLDDSTTHAMLSIVRELVANAVKHGHAKAISVNGELRDGRFVVTVEDDGAGFDMADCPGTDEGHFGLAGARERAVRHNGTLAVESAPGRGTRATVALALPEHSGKHGAEERTE